MVSIAATFENSSGGGRGNGLSNNVEEAVGLHKGAVSTSVHTERCRYLGRLSASSGGLALLPLVSNLPAFVADVESSTLLFRLIAFTFVPLIARFVFLPILPFLSLSSSILL